MILLRLELLWLKLGLIILRLRRRWIDFQLWFWTRGLEITDINNEELLLREEMQGLRRMAAMEPPPYILPDRPRWLDEALKTEFNPDTAEGDNFLKEGYEDWKN